MQVNLTHAPCCSKQDLFVQLSKLTNKKAPSSQPSNSDAGAPEDSFSYASADSQLGSGRASVRAPVHTYAAAPLSEMNPNEGASHTNH